MRRHKAFLGWRTDALTAKQDHGCYAEFIVGWLGVFVLFTPSRKHEASGKTQMIEQGNKENDLRMATVYVPTPLRRLTGGQAKVEATGEDIGTIIQAVDAQYPGVADRLLDDDGNIKRFINVFVNDSEIRGLQGMHTPVKVSDKVSIVPAMAGGQEVQR